MPAAIDIKNLTKQYPVPLKREVVNAVDDLTITIEEGEIFGFLGGNGAGKTTTIKILLGLIYPTAGDASVLGSPAGDIEIKRQIAYLPESPYFYEHMTAREVVTFYAQLFGMPREDARKKADELVGFVGLGGKSDVNKRINEFSKGMRQRVGIAQSLINDPKILFYDEPTSGLDVIARRDIRDLMLDLKDKGKTMFLSSHQLEDVEMVCHRVSIIHKGKLRILGRVDELLAGERVEIIVSHASASLSDKIRPFVAGDMSLAGGSGKIVVGSDPATVSQVIDMIRDDNARIVSIIPKRRSLEDLFVEVVGERISSESGTLVSSEVFNAEPYEDGSNGSGIRRNGVPPVAPQSNAASASDKSDTREADSTDTTDTTETPDGDSDAPPSAINKRPAANKYKELHRK